MKLSMPNRNDLARELRREVATIRAALKTETTLDVRLQVTAAYWHLHWGDASYDQDHRGYWGSASVDLNEPLATSESLDIAEDLIRQVVDDASMDETVPSDE